jgi:hypothetical protein
MGVVCIERDKGSNSSLFSPNSPQEYLSEEEAYMLMRQQSLKLHLRTINDFIVLINNLNNDSKHLTEYEFISILQ